MRIRGIPVRVHPSWFFILFAFTCASQAQINSILDSEAPVLISWLIGFLTALLLFASVVLHELGHSVMAQHEGIKVRSITLFLLGGVARIDKECSTAMSCLRVAIAGPLVNLFLSFLFLGFVEARLNPNPIAINLFAQLGTINLALALFNLLPGLPLDGGVILKSIVWHFTGSRRRGMKVANSTGRFISLVAIFLGCFTCFKTGSLGSLWLVMIGWLGFASSRSQNQVFVLEESLCDLKVSQASRKDFVVLEDDQLLKSISELQLMQTGNKVDDEWMLLCNSGRWVGYLTNDVLNDVPVEDWGKYYLSEYKRPLADLPSISDQDPLWQAVLKLENIKEKRLLVFNRAGLPSGTIDKVDIAELVLNQLGLNLPKSFLENARKNNFYPLGLGLGDLVKGMISSGLVDESRDGSSTR